MATDKALMAAREDRDAARESARRAREQARQEKKEAKIAKRESRQIVTAERKAMGKLALVFAASIGVGTVVGGQLTRVTADWGPKVQWGLLILGLVVIIASKGRTWMQVVGVGLVSAGGVKLSDMSRTRDWIPGDQEWENTIPPAGTKGHRVEVVANNG